MNRTHAAFAIVAGLLVAASAIAIPNARAADTQTIGREVNIPAPPSAAFAGTSGGDGYDVSLANGRIYNVFHHNGDVVVACLTEATGEKCDLVGDTSPWPKVVKPGGTSYATPKESWTFVSPDKKKLYIWAYAGSSSGGVVCLDLTSTAADPSCGYTELTGGVTSAIGQDAWGSSAQVGNKIYASFPGTDGTMRLGCFDLAAGAQCDGAPYTLAEMTGMSADGARSIAADSRVYIAASVAGGTKMTCWDSTNKAKCGANWPVTVNSTYRPVPILSPTGATAGICMLNEASTECFDNVTAAKFDDDAGTPAPEVPAVIKALPGTRSPDYIGASVRLGQRLLVPNMDSGIYCVDFSVSPAASCANSPFVPADLSTLYSINADPSRAGCMWLNADGGTSQIQNFDAFTMTVGCASKQRVSTEQFVPDLEGCPVISWYDVQVTDPATWTTATMSITTPGGAPLTGGSSLSLAPGTPSSLSGVDFTGVANPTFSFEFTGASIAESGVNVLFRFLTTGDLTCQAPGDVPQDAPRSTRSPSMSIDKTAWVGAEKVGTSEANATVASGTQLSYHARALNTGGVTLSSMVISDSIPAGTRYVTGSATCLNAGSTCPVTVANGVVTGSVGDLAPGEAGLVTFDVIVVATSGNITSGAQVTTESLEPAATNAVTLHVGKAAATQTVKPGRGASASTGDHDNSTMWITLGMMGLLFSGGSILRSLPQETLRQIAMALPLLLAFLVIRGLVSVWDFTVTWLPGRSEN